MTVFYEVWFGKWYHFFSNTKCMIVKIIFVEIRTVEFISMIVGSVEQTPESSQT